MRDEEITKAIAKEIEERKKLAFQKNKEAYEIHKEKYVNAFLNLLDNLFKKYLILQNVEDAKKTLDEQKRKYKGELEFICVSFLRSSMEDDSYEYAVRLYDDLFYLDKIGIEEMYKLEYRKKQRIEDSEYFEKLIFKRVIRVKKYEIKDFFREYSQEIYCKPMPHEIEDSLRKIPELESYKKIQKSETVFLQYGELMGEAKKIFAITEDGRK